MHDLNAWDLISMAISAGAGAITAYFSNRIVLAEMWGHIRGHCRELSESRRASEQNSEQIHKLKELAAVYQYQCDQRAREER